MVTVIRSPDRQSQVRTAGPSCVSGTRIRLSAILPRPSSRCRSP